MDPLHIPDRLWSYFEVNEPLCFTLINLKQKSRKPVNYPQGNAFIDSSGAIGISKSNSDLRN